MSELPDDPYDAVTLILRKGCGQTYDGNKYELTAHSVHILYEHWRARVISQHSMYQQRLRDRKFVEWVANYLRVAAQDEYIASGRPLIEAKAAQSSTIRLLQPWTKKTVDHTRKNAWYKVVQPIAGHRSKGKSKAIDPDKERRMAEYKKIQEEIIADREDEDNDGDDYNDPKNRF